MLPWKIRILAIEQFRAVPFATLHLADLGAEVIKRALRTHRDATLGLFG